MKIKLISWNVNGIRACLKKGFMESFDELDADVFSIQETKMQEGQAEIPTPEHLQYFNYAQKKGYSGTATFTRIEPIAVTYDIGEHNNEGRAITLEYEKFYLLNVYVPNSQQELARINYRMKWEDDLRAYVKELDKKKPVIICGDLNVAHNEIDLKNPSSNRKNAGFSDQEREKFSTLLGSGFTDTYRHLYPDETGAYSWWSYMFNARKNNAGWRIDYFVVSDRIADKIIDAKIHPDIFGSDHCPVELEIDI